MRLRKEVGMEDYEWAEWFRHLWNERPHGEVFPHRNGPAILLEVDNLQLLAQVVFGPRGGMKERLLLIDPSQPLYDQVQARSLRTDEGLLIDLRVIRRTEGANRELSKQVLAQLPGLVRADPRRIISCVNSGVIVYAPLSSPSAGAPGLGRRGRRRR